MQVKFLKDKPVKHMSFKEWDCSVYFMQKWWVIFPTIFVFNAYTSNAFSWSHTQPPSSNVVFSETHFSGEFSSVWRDSWFCTNLTAWAFRHGCGHQWEQQIHPNRWALYFYIHWSPIKQQGKKTKTPLILAFGDLYLRVRLQGIKDLSLSTTIKMYAWNRRF